MWNWIQFRVVIRFVVLTSLTLACPLLAVGELRVWKSANGKFEVKAEMVSGDAESVKLRTEDGRELTVPLDKLSEADREYVIAAGDADGNSDDAEKNIRRVFAQFYQAVGKDSVRKFLTAQGKASYDRSPTFFDDVRGPDRGQRPRISKVRIADDQTAEADYRLRMNSKSWQMQMLFAEQDEQWRVSGIIGTGEDGKLNKMDFDTAQMISDFKPPTANKQTSDTKANVPDARFVRLGSKAYKTGFCAKCHGGKGAGTARGPDLTDGQWDHCDGTVEGIRQVLVSGVPKQKLIDSTRQFGMNPATNLVSESDLDALAAYVHALSPD